MCLEWEIFKRTGKIDHYMLLKEAEEMVSTPQGLKVDDLVPGL